MTSSILLILLIVGLAVTATTILRIYRSRLREKEFYEAWVKAQSNEAPASTLDERTFDSWKPTKDVLGTLTVIESDDTSIVGHRFNISKPTTTLGRSADNDVNLPKDIPVSRRHAQIVEKNGGVYLSEVQNMDSSGKEKPPTYGTFLNEIALGQDPVLLQSGDEIRLGKRVRLRFESTGGMADSDSLTYDGLLTSEIDKSSTNDSSPKHQGKGEKTSESLSRPMVSVGYPKLLSKRYESLFLIHIYFSGSRGKVLSALKSEFKSEEINEQVSKSELEVGQKVRIQLIAPEVMFSEPVIKEIGTTVTKITFIGIPKDSCAPGFHKVLLSFWDVEADKEIESLVMTVRVVDYIFDHISRPLLSRVSAFVLGIGTFGIFILTFLEQVDKTLGLTGGTAAGVLATMIYSSFYNSYQRIRTNK